MKNNWVSNNMATNLTKKCENPPQNVFSIRQYQLCDTDFPLNSIQNGHGKRILIARPECMFSAEVMLGAIFTTLVGYCQR